MSTDRRYVRWIDYLAPRPNILIFRYYVRVVITAAASLQVGGLGQSRRRYISVGIESKGLDIYEKGSKEI